MITSICQRFAQVIHRWVKPNNPPLLLEASLDLTRSRSQIILENAFLRQQLIVLNRQVKRPALKPRERVLLVMLTSKLLSWKQALNIVQPDTLLRWHRDLYHWFWKRKSRTKRKQSGRPPISQEIVALIQRMAKENRIWGAKRIRGDLSSSTTPARSGLAIYCKDMICSSAQFSYSSLLNWEHAVSCTSGSHAIPQTNGLLSSYVKPLLSLQVRVS